MANYTKDELIALIQDNPQEFNEWKKNQEDIDFIKGLKKNGKANKLIPTPSSDEEEK